MSFIFHTSWKTFPRRIRFFLRNVFGWCIWKKKDKWHLQPSKTCSLEITWIPVTQMFWLWNMKMFVCIQNQNPIFVGLDFQCIQKHLLKPILFSWVFVRLFFIMSETRDSSFLLGFRWGVGVKSLLKKLNTIKKPWMMVNENHSSITLARHRGTNGSSVLFCLWMKTYILFLASFRCHERNSGYNFVNENILT